MPFFHECIHCGLLCLNKSGLTQHTNARHREMTPEDSDNPAFHYQEHSKLTALRCNQNGAALPLYAGPPALQVNEGSWEPFSDRIAFDFAYQQFVDNRASIKSINKALDTWAASLLQHGDVPPWSSAQEMYQTIDEIQLGPAPWKVYRFRYAGTLPPQPPKWMLETYELCVRDTRLVVHSQLATPTFRDGIHYVPYRQFDRKGKRIRSNVMSADWAWNIADHIARNPTTHGAMLVPIIVGTDKTTVSVATGHQQYHPVYISIGNLTNTARRAHTNAILPVAFLPIPKTTRKQRKQRAWQVFCRQLYHTCLCQIFLPLKPAMTTPELVRCPDDYFRYAIYNLGPHVLDYLEQVWMTAIVQTWCAKCFARPDNLDQPDVRKRTQSLTETLVDCFDQKTLWDNWGIRADITPYTNEFPRADVYQLLAPDLLHQVIKGVFKDHLVKWVNEYLMQFYGEARALEIIQDIDRRISAVPAFPGLRRFPDGRDFQQWTGDDSKALMKVYLGAVAGYLPTAMVQCLAAFLNFAYIARRNALSTTDLQQLESALKQFSHHRQAFVNEGFETSLPRQHSLRHYVDAIRLFGSPNGLCSSMMESKHIKAVKEPWRRSNRYKALIQMLRTIERTDKLQAARNEFTKYGMMQGTALTYTAAVLLGEIPAVVPPPHTPDDWDNDVGPVSGPKDLSKVVLAATYERDYPRNLNQLALFIGQAHFPEALRRFLWAELNPDSNLPASLVPLNDCPTVTAPIYVYHSAVAYFYAPSDLCGAGGMKQERIRSHPSWRGGDARRDTVFIETDADQPGMLGFTIGRVLLFFSFKYRHRSYPCALVHWLVRHGDQPDPETSMWVVCPEYAGNGRRTLEVVHLNTIARAAHLIPVFGPDPLPEDFRYSWSLDVFRAYFVNPYVDNHVHELLIQ